MPNLVKCDIDTVIGLVNAASVIIDLTLALFLQVQISRNVGQAVDGSLID